MPCQAIIRFLNTLQLFFDTVFIIITGFKKGIGVSKVKARKSKKNLVFTTVKFMWITCQYLVFKVVNNSELNFLVVKFENYRLFVVDELTDY